MDDPIQEGFGYEGKGIVLWLTTLADPSKPTVAELAAGVPISGGLYGPTGYALNPTRNRRPITRYASEQELSAAGTVKFELTLLYVYNRENPTEVEGILGTKGVAGYLVHALGYDAGHTFATGDKINDVVPIRTSASDDVPQTANTEAHKTTMPDIIGRVEQEVTVVAA